MNGTTKSTPILARAESIELQLTVKVFFHIITIHYHYANVFLRGNYTNLYPVVR